MTAPRDETAMHSMPWYRCVAPWLLMAGPFVVVVAGFITLWLAIRSNDGLVADDYYKQGLAINQTIAQGQRAEALQLEARMLMRAGQVHVYLKQREGTTLPRHVSAKFSNEARSGVDRSVELAGSDGEFHSAMPDLPHGRWGILLEDADRTWRLSTVVGIPLDQEVHFGPVDSKPVP
jgi:uncharacterized protein